MRKPFVILVVVVGLAGCGESVDDLTSRTVDATNEIADGFEQADMAKIRSGAAALKVIRRKGVGMKIAPTDEREI
jgi:hypothetical protein